MFSTCSELTPRAPILDGRIERFMHPSPTLILFSVILSLSYLSYISYLSYHPRPERLHTRASLHEAGLASDRCYNNSFTVCTNWMIHSTDIIMMVRTIQPERNPNDDCLVIDCLHQTSQPSVSHKHLSWLSSKSILLPFSSISMILIAGKDCL